jgi:hypothetical protein
MNNVDKLVCRIAAHDSIPADANIQDGIDFLLDPNLAKKLVLARERADYCIDTIVQSNNNPYGCDREAIAAAILENINKVKSQKDS